MPDKDPEPPADLIASLHAAIQRSVDDALAARLAHEVSLEIERTVGASYQGPMPPPAMMREFDQVLPGLAREMADAARTEQTHRHRWENRALWNDIFVESGALFLGWTLAGGYAVAASLLAWHGNNIGSAIMLSAPLATIVRAVLRGSGRRAPEITPVERPGTPQKTTAPRI